MTIKSIMIFLLLALPGSAVHAGHPAAGTGGDGSRFGTQSVITAVDGKGDELAAIMLEASRAVAALDGCELYIVQRSTLDASRILVTEVWKDRASHQASLNDERVQAPIARARPIMAAMEGQPAVFVGGHGLEGKTRGTGSK